MEPEIIDWSSIESIFVEDVVFEHFNAPKWVDLSAPDDFLDDDDRAWFCKQNCKHPKCAEDFLKPPRSSKVKILRSLTIPEIFPFKDRNRRNGGQGGKENKSSSSEEKPNAENLLSAKKLNSSIFLEGDSENSDPDVSLPPLSGKRVEGLMQFTNKPALKTNEQVVDDLHTNIPNLLSTKKLKSSKFLQGDSENSDPNVSLPPLSGKRVKGLKQFTTKPALKTKEQIVDDLHTNIPKTDRKPKLRNAFSARNLIGGRDILGQLTGICSGLKNLARRKSKKGSSENLTGGASTEKGTRACQKEMVPVLVVKDGTV